MNRQRLDILLTERGLTSSRSQAASLIKLGDVMVDGQVITKPGHVTSENSQIVLLTDQQYVGRAGLKLASVAQALSLDFGGKTVLDVGSSTGGFTDYTLRHGAKKVYAVDVGADQLHPTLRDNPNIELHEKTDIRDFHLLNKPDIILIDVSFISLRQILPHIADNLCGPDTRVVAMVKPQFEAGKNQVNKGVIKNESIRRQIFRDFEIWAKQKFLIISKNDSSVSGAKGNRERFYLLRCFTKH